MKKQDIISYLKIFGGLMMISPLVVAFFSLDFGLFKSILITSAMYVIMMLIAIPMFNYLQYGSFSYLVNEKLRNKWNSDSVVECEKHSWVKMSDRSRWCEKCYKRTEKY